MLGLSVLGGRGTVLGLICSGRVGTVFVGRSSVCTGLSCALSFTVGSELCVFVLVVGFPSTSLWYKLLSTF